MTQATLDFTPPPVATKRLPSHLREILDAIDGVWRTGYEVQQIMNSGGYRISESNATRRIRDLRAYGLDVETRKRKGSTAWEYRV